MWAASGRPITRSTFRRTHLSTFSLAASIRQSFPRAFGGSRQRQSSHRSLCGRRNTPGSGVSSTREEQPLLDVTGLIRQPGPRSSSVRHRLAPQSWRSIIFGLSRREAPRRFSCCVTPASKCHDIDNPGLIK
ncbi:hypothetical protein E2C01_026581 [Portunus trituberculatus]|uniref:Uncharacterized protein n=1 Tax=Portunus trituberculatus TaxID=210409 RepID=A0A5B7EIP8_PORTR|nr:hypothetical protein [Portunus trituberculatus]